MIYPTPRLLSLCAVAILAAMATTALAPAAWSVPAVAAFVLILAALLDSLFVAGPKDLSLEVDAPPSVGVGRPEPLTVAGAFQRFAPRELEMRLALAPGLGVTPLVLKIQPQSGAVRAPFSLNPLFRGPSSLEAAYVRWRGPLGLAFVQKRADLAKAITVTPDYQGLRQDATQLFSRDAEFGVKAQRRLDEGSEYHALRDFQPGMDRRFIDWRQSARHMRLLAKEFQAERNHNIVLAFDTGRLMGEPVRGLTRMDRAVHAGLLAAYAALNVGDRIQVFSFDSSPRQCSAPAAGVAAYPFVQTLISGIDDRPEESNFTLGLGDLGGRLSRRSLVIVFTDFVDHASAELMVESLGRLGKKHLVLFVAFEDEALQNLANADIGEAADITRAVFADRLLRQREAVFLRLRRLGVEVLEAKTEAYALSLVLAYLDLKRADRL